MNKVILMETGETPSLGPSRCFAHLFLLFTLHLAYLYEVPIPKCEGDGKGLKALLSFLISFSPSFMSVMFPSLSKPLFLHFINFSTLIVRARDVRNFHKT